MNSGKILSGIAILVMISNIAIAQNGKMKKADKLFTSYNYSDAAVRYNELEVKSVEVLRREAESLKLFGNFPEAENLYSQIVAMEGTIADDHYNYSYVLRINKKYKESDRELEQYYLQKQSDSRGLKLIDNKEYFDKISKDEKRYSIENMSFNTDAQEFSPAYFKNALVFSSSRTITGTSVRIYNRNKKPFLNIYRYDIEKGSDINNPIEFWKKINKKYHEGPVAFDKSGTFMAYTRNNYKEKSTVGSINLEIFFSQQIDGKWSAPIAFEYNNKEHSVGHPYLSDDGKTMYFASDMEGSIGGTDIFKTTRNEDNSWTKPENIGLLINTEGNEMFPYMSYEGNLIFASDGHLGLGGLDLFITDPKMTKVLNMGVPLNTNADDFGFIVDDQMVKGYFSSNREGGKGDDDIYSIQLLKPYVWGKIIRGTALDTKGNVLANSSVTLFDDKGNQIGNVITAEDGKYLFKVDPDRDFKLTGTKEKYFDGANTASTKTDKDEVIADVVLEQDPGFLLYGLITDSKTKSVIVDAKITLVDKNTGLRESYSTSQQGDFLKILTDNKLNDKVSFDFILEKEGYFSKTVSYNAVLTRPGQYNIHEVLDFSMDIEVKDLAELIQINPIYFDLDKYNIRPDAALELDKIVEIMNKYPNMVVELGSHTDCRAPAAYNEKLSDNRAKASATYIKGKIVNPERITGKGYGETQLKNQCECEGAKVVPCTEEEHQLNRRTEFKVISTGNDKVKVVE
jgi:outer membrane protein OmpA-like peptidoglycan-associated protein